MRTVLYFLSLAFLSACSLSACGVPARPRADTNAKHKQTTISVVSKSSISEISSGRIDPLDSVSTPSKLQRLSHVRLDNFKTYSVHRGEITALALSEKGAVAFSAGVDGQVLRNKVLPIQGGAGEYLESELILSSNRPLLALALSPGNRRLAVAGYSHVAVYNLAKNNIEAEFTRIQGRITELAWDPLGRLLAFGTARGAVHIWNLKDTEFAGEDNLEALESYTGLDSSVVGLQFHPSGRALFAAARDGAVHVYRLLRTDLEMGLRDSEYLRDSQKVKKQSKRTNSSNSRLLGLAMQNSGNLMFGWGVQGGVDIWKVRGLKRQDRIHASSEALEGLALLSSSPFGEILATTGRDSQLRFWCMDPKKKRELGLREREPQRFEEETQNTNENGTANSSRAPITLSYGRFEAKKDSRFIGETQRFSVPLDLLAATAGSSLLWATQKTGNLVTFEADSLSSYSHLQSRAARCR